MKNFATAVKIFFVTLLGYYALNTLYSSMHLIAQVLIYQISVTWIRNRLDDIALYAFGALSYYVCKKLVSFIMKQEDQYGKTLRNIGIMSILNHGIFLIDWFRYSEGSALFHICNIVIGFFCIGVYYNIKHPD